MVVSNTSPMMNLAAIGRLDLLPALFDTVHIPQAVALELRDIEVRSSIGLHLGELPWLVQGAVWGEKVVEALCVHLHPGEAEAIAMAIEQDQALLLMDERRGRRIARGTGLRVIGVLGILVASKRKGFIGAVRPLLDALVSDAGFWVGQDLYARVLRDAGE